MKQKSNMVNQKIGNRLREIRKSSGMSQMALAEKIRVSYQQLQKYESGASKLNIDRLQQIAHALNQSIHIFFIEDRDEATLDTSDLKEDEIILLRLFRRIARKELRDKIIFLANDLACISSSNSNNQL